MPHTNSNTSEATLLDAEKREGSKGPLDSVGLRGISILHYSRVQKPWSACNKPGYREQKVTNQNSESHIYPYTNFKCHAVCWCIFLLATRRLL